MVILKRTNSSDEDFVKLIQELDQNLAKKNGDKNEFFQQFNKVDLIHHVVIIYDDENAVACGAFKKLDENSVEIKRMYTKTEARKKGFAQQILTELIHWAKEEGYTDAVLETGEKMKEAIRLYKAYGFETIPNFPPYENENTSICFKKFII